MVDNQLKVTQREEANVSRGSLSAEAWEHILKDGLARHRRGKAKKPSQDSYHIEQHSGMSIEDVLFGIAAIWEPLRKLDLFQEPDFGYAFAGLDVFDPETVAGGLLGPGVVGKQNKFIMPVLFRPSEEEALEYFYKLQTYRRDRVGPNSGKHSRADEPLGHLILAVAERDSWASREIRIYVRDSLCWYVDRKTVDEKLQELVMSSGWMTQPRADQDRRLRDVSQSPITCSIIDIDVPQQSDPYSCGLSTILNAWAVMLGVPIRQDLERLSDGRDDLDIGLEIVNLALAGCMDSRTIRAWLYVSGLSEDPRSSMLDVAPNFEVEASSMNAAKMEYVTIHQKIKDQSKDLDYLQSMPSPTVSMPTEVETSLHEYPIWRLTDMAGWCITRERAIEILESTNGDLEMAVDGLFLDA